MPAKPVPGRFDVSKSKNVKSKRSGIRKKRAARSSKTGAQARARSTDIPVASESSCYDSDNEQDPALSWQLATDLADQQTDADDACFSSPETALHGPADASFLEYKARLMADPAHRCVKVAENQRGVVCLAVATGKLEASSLLIQVQW